MDGYWRLDWPEIAGKMGCTADAARVLWALGLRAKRAASLLEVMIGGENVLDRPLLEHRH